MFHRFHTGTWQRRASGRVPTRWPTSCEGDNHNVCSEFVPFLLLFDCQEAFHCCLVVTCINRINMISIQCHRVGEWWSGKPEFENVSDLAGVYIPFKLHVPFINWKSEIRYLNEARTTLFLWCFLCIQVLLGLAKFSHGLSRYIRDGPWGGKGLSPGGSKAHYGSARGLPRMPVRSLPARHVLMGSLTFLTFWSRSDTFFTFCQGFLRIKRGRRAALEHVCAHGIKSRPPKQ